MTKTSEMAVGVAIMGRMESVRTSPLPQNSRLKMTATVMPSAVYDVTR